MCKKNFIIDAICIQITGKSITSYILIIIAKKSYEYSVKSYV
jgi:hypothetical protein